MSGSLRALDRVVVGLVGLVLLVGGLGVAELHWQFFGDWPTVLQTPGVRDVLDQSWAPWAVAGTAVVLALVALWWLWSHLSPGTEDFVRLAGSDPTGRLEVELPALADVVAQQVEQRGRLRKVSVTTREEGYFSLIEVSARLRRQAEVAPVVDAAERLTAELATAFPDDAVTGRLMVSAPSRRAPRNDKRSEVLEAQAGPERGTTAYAAEQVHEVPGRDAPRALGPGSRDGSTTTKS